MNPKCFSSDCFPGVPSPTASKGDFKSPKGGWLQLPIPAVGAETGAQNTGEAGMVMVTKMPWLHRQTLCGGKVDPNKSASTPTHGHLLQRRPSHHQLL